MIIDMKNNNILIRKKLSILIKVMCNAFIKFISMLTYPCFNLVFRRDVSNQNLPVVTNPN